MPPRDDEDDPLTRDLEETLGDVAKPSLFLGVFPEAEIRRALTRHGLDRALAAKGLSPWRLELHLEDTFEHRLVVACDAGTIVDTTLKRTRTSLPLVPALGHFEALEIRWLELANPNGTFTPSRPPLPGQRHPGLGLAREAFALEKAIARRLRCEALVTRPRWYHNAAIYLAAGYRMSHPEDAAALAALTRSWSGRPLSEASAAVEDLSPPVAFGEMCFPLSARLRAAWPSDPSLAMGAPAR